METGKQRKRFRDYGVKGSEGTEGKSYGVRAFRDRRKGVGQ